MATRRFEWDPDKALRNFDKHNVKFEEAATIFAKDQTSTTYDHEHNDEEVRYNAVGISSAGRLLFVVYNESDDSIRFISARKAKPREEINYAKHSI